MRVVLLEAANSREASQGSRQLVSVQDAKVGHAERKLSPGARTVIKHQAGSKQRGGKKSVKTQCDFNLKLRQKHRFKTTLRVNARFDATDKTI